MRGVDALFPCCIVNERRGTTNKGKELYLRALPRQDGFARVRAHVLGRTRANVCTCLGASRRTERAARRCLRLDAANRSRRKDLSTVGVTVVVVVVVSARDIMGKDNHRLIGSLRARVYAPGQRKIASGFPTSPVSTCKLRPGRFNV